MSKITSAMAALGVVAGLGVAALPMATYAQQSGPVTIQAEVNSSIAVSAADELVDLGTINSGTPIHEKSTVVTVTGTGGFLYTLKVEDTDSVTDLVKVDGDGSYIASPTDAQKIPANANLAKGTSGWAFKGGDLTAWTAMAASGAPVTVVNAGTLAAPTDDGDTALKSNQTEVTFGVSAGSGLDNGTYKDQVVFTVVARS